MQTPLKSHEKLRNDLNQDTKTFLAKGGKITMLDHGQITQLDNGYQTSQKKRLSRLGFESEGKT
jgi:hypothetical protein